MMLRPEMLNLMRASEGGRYGMGYSGGGLIGGGLVAGSSGAGLPKALKEELYSQVPAYRARVDKARARGGPPLASPAEAKARGERAAATRRDNAQEAARLTVLEATGSGVRKLSDIKLIYRDNLAQVSKEKRADKRDIKKRQEAQVRGVPIEGRYEPGGPGYRAPQHRRAHPGSL